MSPVRSVAGWSERPWSERPLSDDSWTSEGRAETRGWRRLLALDASLLLVARRYQATWLTSLMQALTRLGDTASWLVLALVLATLGGEGPRCALLLLGGASTALTVSQVVKRGVRRTRPSEAGLRGFAALSRDPDAFSFPSGHTAVAFAVAVALAGEGEGLAWVLLPLAAGIGTSRVYLGAHYPLDVIVGALLGTISGLLVRGVVDGSLLLGLRALAGLVSCM